MVHAEEPFVRTGKKTLVIGTHNKDGEHSSDKKRRVQCSSVKSVILVCFCHFAAAAVSFVYYYDNHVSIPKL